MRKAAFFFLLVCFARSASAQVNLNDSIVSANIFQVELGIGMPAGDIADRFGFHATVGGGYEFKTQNNLLLGFNGSYIFGSRVMDSSINSLYTDFGFVIGTDGTQFSPILSEQGFSFSLQMGKITKLFSVNPNSGVAFIGGVGLLEHNILIYVDELYVPQVDKEYSKGYDRLSTGLALNQYIGYYFFSNKHFVNFRAGFDVTEAFTKNRRYNFDTNSMDDATHFDMLVTFKATWNLPVFEHKQRKYYY